MVENQEGSEAFGAQLRDRNDVGGPRDLAWLSVKVLMVRFGRAVTKAGLIGLRVICDGNFGLDSSG
jgi:hypothetical protein